MKNWTINKRIIVGFAIIVTLSTVMGIMAWSSMRIIGEHADELSDDAIVGLDRSADLMQHLTHAHLALVRHVVSTNLDEKRTLEGTLAEIATENTKLMSDMEKVCDSPEEKSLFGKMQQARQDYIVARVPILKLSNAGKSDEAMALLMTSARAAYDAYDKASMDFNDFETDLSEKAAATIQHNAKSSKIMLASVVAGELALSIFIGFIVITGLNRVLNRVSLSLEEGAEQVTSAAGQVSCSSQSLAEGASEQAASLEETSSSLEEMANMTRRNAENAQKANDLAKQAREAADRGAADMQSMSAAMGAIKVSSDDIAKIIKTIDEIAFQTNILALNAAVEAARAGEAGMGFAVVADEVRNLAQRSAQAAKETAGKIEGAITKTAQGVNISSKVEQALNDIVAKVRQVDELVAEVTGASREQTEGITQINSAVGQMDKVTQSNAANAEESAAAAEELNAPATVKESVTELLNLVGGHAQRNISKVNRSSVHVREARVPTPKVKRLPLSHTNGHAQKELPIPTKTNGRSEIPLADDFKDF
jgi:methyl-accepting chemotaxis protein